VVTLIAALRCRDGIILGSDSRETRGRLGRRLARPAQKIYEPKRGFLLAWAGFQDVAQGFALRLERAGEISPQQDRTMIKGLLHEIVAELRSDSSVEGHSDMFEFLVAWFSIPDRKPVALHLRSGGTGEWVSRWEFGGTTVAVEIAGFAIGTLRYLDPAELTLEQGKLVALKVLRDTIATGVEEVGGEIQLAVVSNRESQVIPFRDMRGLHDTLDLWESQAAELLPGAIAAPADSSTPDRGVGPPS
jgi:hypothetical protein